MALSNALRLLRALATEPAGSPATAVAPVPRLAPPAATTGIARGRQLEAAQIARIATEVLARRGLKPTFAFWALVADGTETWLFGVLDVGQLERLERYTDPDLLHQISTVIGGRPVFISNSSGLRYAIPLFQPPPLPRRVDFPGFEREMLLLGQCQRGGTARLPWTEAGHQMVVGMTGSGKSVMLRLIAAQALNEGHQLLLGDLDGATFAMLGGHPALLADIAATPEALLTLVERGLGECDARAAAYAVLPGYPETLEEYNRLAIPAGAPPLPRLVVILDEFNTAVLALGGAKGPLARSAAELGWRGRKFGLHLVFAAQDFSKEIVGRVRDQIGTVLCFRVRSAEVARNVGCPAAYRIPAQRPGLAISDRWGLLQGFYFPKAQLITLGQGLGIDPLTDGERALALRALAETGGRLSLPLLRAWGGTTEWKARKLLEEWEQRGWLHRDPARDNARYITPKLQGLLSNHPTAQTAASPLKPPQTAGD